ncbi:MAG: hypothetical protein GX221_00110 [Candidatus Riflebacteria bacterium]|nr:hypothetical protein [Candidatus Riflebacteria bacterium]
MKKALLIQPRQRIIPQTFSLLVTVIFIILALALIIKGISLDHHKSIYGKARYVCTQCIGLG